MIRNIVFDMGNVLIRFDPQYFLRNFDEADRTLLLREGFGSVEWIRMDRGDLSEKEALALIRARLPERLHEAAALLPHWYEDLLPVPGMEELAAELKEAGYALYLLSNVHKSFYSYHDRIAALQHFSGEFASADWGVIKPDERIFRLFYAHFHLVPGECFFIDDSAPNVEGARRTGMDGMVFHGDIGRLRDALRESGVRLREG